MRACRASATLFRSSAVCAAGAPMLRAAKMTCVVIGARRYMLRWLLRYDVLMICAAFATCVARYGAAMMRRCALRFMRVCPIVIRGHMFIAIIDAAARRITDAFFRHITLAIAARQPRRLISRSPAC